jgi:outer membrane protein assembly factor BamB
MVVSRDRVALLRVRETPTGSISKVSVETWQKITGKQHQEFAPISSSSPVDLGDSSLAATDDTILLFLPNRPKAKIYGYAPETGKLKFKISTLVQRGSSNNFYRYVRFGGSTVYQYIYNGSNRGKSVISVEAYDANTGKLRWQVPISDSRCTDFGVVPGGLYLNCQGFSSSPTYLKFLDETTGQQQWMKPFEGEVQLAATRISYGSLDGYGATSDAIFAYAGRVDAQKQSTRRLVILSKTDGRELWSYDPSEIETIYGADGDRIFLDSEVPRLSDLGIRF